MDALIGHTGFVGGNLLRQHRFDACFNTSNIETIAGRDFGTLVFSGAQAKKWWANQNPEADRAGIQRALDAMRGVTARRVILISTIDVVPQVPGADEGFDCASHATHPYGEHRLWLEQELRARYPGMLTVRLPGLFGPGLQKNILYDLLHDNMVDRIDPLARFQFYDLTALWADIARAQEAGLALVHLVPAPVRTADIVARFFPGATVGDPPRSGSPSYDFRTRHAAVFGGRDGHIHDADEVFRRLAAFIAAERQA
jgi:nucleoside-diphosphate-sugar epimerase